MKSLLLAALLALSTSSWALDLKFGTIAPAGTPWSDSLEVIKNRVATESKGDLKIKVFLGGQLGGELEILQKIRRGQIAGGGLTCSAMASVIPELDVLEIPFLFNSSEEADFVLDNYLLPVFKDLLLKKGFVLVTWAENGWRSIGHKTKQIKTPADLKAVKIRSQESKVHLAFWKKLGASAQAISTPEVLPALQTGVVEAFDNTPLFTLAAEWQTAIKHYSVTNHIYQPAVVVYSKVAWDKLKPEQQKILMGPGNEQAKDIRMSVRKLGDSLIEVLKESKINVYNPTTAEMNSFKSAVAGLDQEMIKSIGGKAAEIYKLVQDGKAAYKAKK